MWCEIRGEQVRSDARCDSPGEAATCCLHASRHRPMTTATTDRTRSSESKVAVGRCVKRIGRLHDDYRVIIR
jgi:hypothetical protein